jgi:succinate dehydrogenase/fumarate reductase flavoprotein subunit
MTEKRISTDVLVIGGGMAGSFAAVKAKEQGLDVTMADKSYAGKGGATHYADGNLIYFRPERGHRLKDWADLICQRGEYLNYRDWTEICLEESKDRFDDMVAWGIPFYRPQGKLFINNPDSTWIGMDEIVGGIDQEGVYESVDFAYRKYAPALRQKVQEFGVNILDRVMFNELLRQDGEIVGAVGFHTASGDLYVIQAKAVVIATGSGGFKAECNWNNYWTGDGEAMAYRSGAAIVGQEFGRPGTDMPMRVDVKRQEKISREAALSGKLVDTVANSPFIGGMVSGWLRPNLNIEGQPAISAAWEAHCGRIPLITDLDAWTPQQMEWMHHYKETRGAPTEERIGFDIFKRGKVIFPATRIWVAPVPGGSGIWPIDKSCATEIPGLYAAGDTCATMACGAAYGGMGFGLNHAAVTGSRAGLGAAKRAKKIKSIILNSDEVTKTRKIVCAPVERIGGFTAGWLTQIIQSITIPYFYLGVKHGERLQAAVTIAEFINKHLVPKLMAKDAHEWRMALEAKNMAHTAEMRLKSSLFRAESRGTHFREDYPRRDDPAWLALVKIKEEHGKMKLYKESTPQKWWPDLSTTYEERYPRMFPGE